MNPVLATSWLSHLFLAPYSLRLLTIGPTCTTDIELKLAKHLGIMYAVSLTLPRHDSDLNPVGSDNLADLDDRLKKTFRERRILERTNSARPKVGQLENGLRQRHASTS